MADNRGMPSPPKRLAIFDLDHTLIPYDSGMAWSKFLIAEGVLEPGFVDVALEHARRYAAGTLDVFEQQRLFLGVLARFDRVRLDEYRRHYTEQLRDLVPPSAAALVRRHADAGELTVIATATTRYIAEPYAALFGVEHLVASEACQLADGRFGGDVQGEPSYAAGKPLAIARWLSSIGLRRESFERISAYSDSFNDVPLLEYATNPVAVQPDPRLAAICVERGWRVAPTLDATLDSTFPG